MKLLQLLGRTLPDGTGPSTKPEVVTTNAHALSLNNDEDKTRQLYLLGSQYHDRFHQTGIVTDLEAAIEHLHEAVNITPMNHSDRPDRIYHLAICYEDKYIRTSLVSDLSLAIELFEVATSMVSEDRLGHSRRLHRLGNGYHKRYKLNGRTEDLALAIQIYHDAFDTAAKIHGHPNRARQLCDLGDGYLERYRRTGARADLDIAIENSREALSMTPKDDPEISQRHLALGNIYYEKYQNSKSLCDLELVIQTFTDSLDATPETHPDRSARLSDLGGRYTDKYARLGESADIEIAIRMLQEAVNLTPHNHRELAGRIQNLGLAHGEKYRRLGDIVDLDITVQLLQRAVNMAPVGYLSRLGLLQGLGIAYRDRFSKIGALADMELAIQHFKEALGTFPDGHITKMGLLLQLGSAYCNKFRRTNAMQDVEMAIYWHQQALDVTPDGHPNRAQHLHSLGVTWGEKYKRTGAQADLDMAIQILQEATDLMSSDDPSQMTCLHDLGTGYGDRYEKTRAMEDLQMAMQNFQESLKRTPTDHPAGARHLHSLGMGCLHRFSRTSSATDLDAAFQSLEQGLHHSNSPIVDRLRPGQTLLKLCILTENWTVGAETAATALALAHSLVSHSLSNTDKQFLLTEVVGMASDATAIATLLGEPAHIGLTLLEAGRGILAGSLHAIRVDILDLQQRHPELAKKYTQLQAILDSSIKAPNQIHQRHDAAKELEQLTEDIRKLDHFYRFLLPPTEEELKNAAVDGPIVIINLSDCRCDAFIIQKSQVGVLPLPLLHKSDVQSRVGMLDSPEVLMWLWNTTAKPILDALNYISTPVNGCWPRVCWIPTGELTKFPIHAAGIHLQGCHDSVIDRVISSYSTSVKALMYGRRNRLNTPPRQSSKRIVLVDMPVTPGQDNLPFTSQEINKLRDLCDSSQLQVCQPVPRRKEILSVLKDCFIFHFAGHGHADQSDPSKSCLLLQNEGLAVGDLFESNLREQAPFLAYLSACGTGQMKHDQLADEGFHLMAACQLAGFQNVIGTLWSVNDKTCGDVATMTYKWMLDQGISNESVGEALHHACRSLRAQWISDNYEGMELKYRTTINNEDASPLQAQQAQVIERDSRNMAVCNNEELSQAHWIPYLHFGI